MLTLKNAFLWGSFFIAVYGSVAGSNSNSQSPEKLTIDREPAMVTVPKGTFVMGFDDLGAYPEQTAPYTASGIVPGPSGPVRKVTLTNDYQIGKYEITNGEYCDMLNYALVKGYLTGDYSNNITVKNKEGNRQELLNLDADYEGKQCEIYFNGTRFAVRSGLERRPVVYVTWYGAAFYCNILGEWKGYSKLYNLADWSCTFNGTPRFYGVSGYRLPTEAEWEYAARYDTNNMKFDRRPVPWESSLAAYRKESNFNNNLAYFKPYANYKTNIGTVDVGSFEQGKSYLGIYDLAGNVSEWAQDYYSPYTYFAPYTAPSVMNNPVNDTSGVYRQRRGGGWLVYANNIPLTFYHTDTNYPYTNYCDFGFRIVRIP